MMSGRNEVVEKEEKPERWSGKGEKPQQLEEQQQKEEEYANQEKEEERQKEEDE